MLHGVPCVPFLHSLIYKYTIRLCYIIYYILFPFIYYVLYTIYYILDAIYYILYIVYNIPYTM